MNTMQSALLKSGHITEKDIGKKEVKSKKKANYLKYEESRNKLIKEQFHNNYELHSIVTGVNAKLDSGHTFYCPQCSKNINTERAWPRFNSQNEFPTKRFQCYACYVEQISQAAGI